ncbi:hypothetical protein B0T26DRAFT_681229 [Lasiosphaeria miniovina]|uniref:Uncharacterized protein n=1 Tax=Lasiosphaeria miniovina TaxID=1954250 RepID=A0AA39ZU07_9PEZI|nr:uncharacterized protein B0T26DRAFT_681229 [Lasiosphaeria miniovina]KAK0703571.1 hypothetical protein B0T26DRAFT_681229 [Lasiosphaeria miniovina]
MAELQRRGAVMPQVQVSHQQVSRKRTTINSSGTELSQSRREQSPVNGGLARHATPVPTVKSQLDATSENDPLPAKRVRLTRTGIQRPGVEGVGQAGDGDNGERQLKRAQLTRENLTLFNKMARKKGSKKGSTYYDSADESITTRAISTTSSRFDIRAYQNGIRDPLSSKLPTNIKGIVEKYAQSRETASPTDSEYKFYARAVSKAGNEAAVAGEVTEELLKKCRDDSYKRSFNQAFTAFPKNKRPTNLRVYQGRPGEWEGPDVDISKATRQSGHDGAALVYARNQALSYIGKPDPPGHAEITTFTTDGTNLNFYAHYATPSGDNGKLEYHQYQYASVNVKDTYQGHNDGRKGIRNEQDHA